MQYWDLSSFLLFLVVLIHTRMLCSAGDTCTKSGLCSCTFGNGSVVDLKPLSQKPPMTVKDGLYNYDWNPCDNFVFEFHGNKMTVGGLARLDDGSSVEELGYNSDETTWVTMSSGEPVFWMKPKPPAERQLEVICKCDHSSKPALEWGGKSTGTPVTYRLILTAPNCCPVEQGGGLSVGSIMCIIFFSVLLMYFLLGAIFQTAVRKANGAERVPNAAFWGALPGLIKDGFVFVFTCGKGSTSGYGKI